MSRLMSLLRGSADRGAHRGADRGAVTAMVALLLGGGVLLGSGALVVDIGRLYAEQAQLQNAADAGSLALAQVCASGATACNKTTAASYANNNSSDRTSTVDVVCGSDRNHALPACPSDNPAYCTGNRPSGNFVEVRTSTRQSDGSTILPATFGQAVAGYEGSRVAACSRVAWGGPSAAYGFGLTISLCEWQTATSDGTVYAPSSNVTASYERVLKLHTTSGTTCPSAPSGWVLPGGFGWLADATGHCQTRVDLTGEYRADTGVSGSSACKVEIERARTNKTVLLVPVYDGMGGTGHEGNFHLKGFGSFVVTGYYLPGFKEASTLTTKNYCKGDDKCVYGYFTSSLLPADATLGGPELGATTVRVIG